MGRDDENLSKGLNAAECFLWQKKSRILCMREKESLHLPVTDEIMLGMNFSATPIDHSELPYINEVEGEGVTATLNTMPIQKTVQLVVMIRLNVRVV